MPKNLQCPSCSDVIAVFQDNKIVFPEMKALSIVEFNHVTHQKDVKCRCGTWINITSDNQLVINHQRKGQDALYNATNAVYRNGKNLKK
jgi:hypothetical protein